MGTGFMFPIFATWVVLASSRRKDAEKAGKYPAFKREVCIVIILILCPKLLYFLIFSCQ